MSMEEVKTRNLLDKLDKLGWDLRRWDADIFRWVQENQFQTVKEAWLACEDPHWLLKYARCHNVLSVRRCLEIGVECLRQVLPLCERTFGTSGLFFTSKHRPYDLRTGLSGVWRYWPHYTIKERLRQLRRLALECIGLAGTHGQPGAILGILQERIKRRMDEKEVDVENDLDFAIEEAYRCHAFLANGATRAGIAGARAEALWQCDLIRSMIPFPIDRNVGAVCDDWRQLIAVNQYDMDPRYPYTPRPFKRCEPWQQDRCYWVAVDGEALALMPNSGGATIRLVEHELVGAGAHHVYVVWQPFNSSGPAWAKWAKKWSERTVAGKGIGFFHAAGRWVRRDRRGMGRILFDFDFSDYFSPDDRRYWRLG